MATVLEKIPGYLVILASQPYDHGIRYDIDLVGVFPPSFQGFMTSGNNSKWTQCTPISREWGM